MTFNHLEIEPKWQKYWKEHHTFKTTEDPSKKTSTALDMFPLSFRTRDFMWDTQKVIQQQMPFLV